MGIWSLKNLNLNPSYSIGQKIDSFNNIEVYYNGGINNVEDRNTSKDGYNIGLKYQCVEFVKRYYYEEYNHKMPNSYGNAKDFYNSAIKDGNLNKDRNLIQCSNPSNFKPTIGALIVFRGTMFNKYGHVAIISKVSNTEVEIIQQNPGPYKKSRETFELVKYEDKWEIKNSKILGWLKIKK